LRDAMDELRRDLAQSGFSNTSLDLRQGSGQEQARQQFAFMNSGRTSNGGGGNAPAPVETAPPVRSRPTGNSRLDIEA